MAKPTDESADAGAPATSAGSLKWVIAPVLIFAALVALFAFALETGDPTKLPSALIGKPVPVTTFPAVEGLRESEQPVLGFASSDLANGKVSVVNFWASWCATCADEQALLLQLRDSAGVPLYGVNYKDEPAAARRFLGRYGNPFQAVGTDVNGRSAIEWGVYGMPETFVINGKGEIAFKHIGAVTPESLQTRLLPAIAQARAEAKAAATPVPPR